MKKQTTNLLVVDDEKVVCESCARILSERGFSVETSTDASRGLKLATEKDYAVILLDIKMPTIDGFEFLEELKRKHKDVRVVMITGYSSAENAATATQLGAVEFIPKPFSPNELFNAVARAVPQEKEDAESTTAVAEPVPAPVEEKRVAEYPQEFYFLDEAWMQRAPYDSVRVGAFLPSEASRAISSIELPKVGDVVYRGLPLASFTVEGKARRVVPSPVTGQVVEVHETLADAKSDIWGKPCQEGWIASIRPRNLEEDLGACRARSVILASADAKAEQERVELLSSLGCTVSVVETPSIALEAVKKGRGSVLMIDATSLGNEGPELVKHINNLFPEVKVVVAADSDSKWEAEYRATKILYYAVEPLADMEMVDVLHSVFGPTIQPAPEIAPSRKLPNWINKVSITNRHSRQVNLLAAGEILFSHKGLGLQLRELIFNNNCPITFTLGAKKLNVIDIINEVDDCDRLLLLEVKDVGRIPGSLAITPGSELVKGLSSGEHKIRTLVIQPEEDAGLVFDARTSRALAELILKEMTSN